MKSTYKKISLKDIAKGYILAFITTLVTTSITLINILVTNGTFDLSWHVLKPGLYAAALSGVSYLIKNFFTNSKDQFAKPEPMNPKF